MSNNVNFDLASHQKLSPFEICFVKSSKKSLERGLQIEWGEIKTTTPPKCLFPVRVSYGTVKYLSSVSSLSSFMGSVKPRVYLLNSSDSIEESRIERYETTEDGNIKAAGPVAWGASASVDGVYANAVTEIETYKDEDGKTQIKTTLEPLVYYFEALE